MWETIKNDPILKTVVVIVLGVLAFGFAFNIMFGTSGGEMGHEGGGYSLSNSLGNTTTVLTKILLIVVLIAAIIAVVKFLRGYLVGVKEIKMPGSIGKSPYAKIAAVVVGLLLVLILISGITYGALSILLILTKILLMISVIGLIVGIVMYLMQTRGVNESKVKLNILSAEKCPLCGSNISKEYKFCPNCSANLKKECVKCGTELKDEWACCPVCGNENTAKKANAPTEDVKEDTKDNDSVSNHNNVEADNKDGQVVDVKKDDVN